MQVLKTKNSNQGTGNTLQALNDLLFEQLEILNDSSLKGEELQEEITRIDKMVDVGKLIVANASTCLHAASIVKKDGGYVEIPKMIDG